MSKLEKFLVISARRCADASVNKFPCLFVLYQPKVSEELKNRLKETRKK